MAIVIEGEQVTLERNAIVENNLIFFTKKIKERKEKNEK